MSLLTQTWLAVVCLMILGFGGSSVVSSLSAKAYLEQQLYMKNSDNATALALSLSQQDANEVLLELTLAAQFDTGHYEMIQMTDAKGQVLILREDNQPITEAPEWFIRLLPIEVQPGVAQVQQGWQQLGTLSLRSHVRFAYRELWTSTKMLAGYFFAAMILASALSMIVLKKILRPLDDVVEQAKAMGDRRFITIAEPRTLEFKALVQSMNNLSDRIKKMLQQEANRLEKWRKDTQVDQVSGILNREPFMKLLSSALTRDDANAAGVITLLRVGNLAQLNQVHGRKVIDSALSAFGKALTSLISQNIGWVAGRLNGSDFAVLSPRALHPNEIAAQIQQIMFEVLAEKNLDQEILLPVACRSYHSGDTISDVFTSLDGALLASDQEGESGITLTSSDSTDILPVRQELEQWTETFNSAFAEHKFSLVSYPAATMAGKKIHEEALVRLTSSSGLVPAGRFLPWISRLDLSADLDREVVTLALAKIEHKSEAVCINLSAAAISDPQFHLWMSETLQNVPEQTRRMLWMEAQESVAYRHLDDFKSLCVQMKNFGCTVGIEHVGHQLGNIGLLHDVGLDYVKIDAPFVSDIDSNIANQTLLRTLCTVVHSIGLTAIAEGVRNDAEWHTLENLGFDAASGPYVSGILQS